MDNATASRTTGTPTIDVVIPMRNRMDFIASCLDSVRAQTLAPNSVIVVDDGSSDASASIVAAYSRTWSRVRLIKIAASGVSAARNRGISESQAELVALIDSDDIWQPTKLAKQAALFRADRPRLSLVYCGFRRIDAAGQVLNLPAVVSDKRGELFRETLERFHGIAPSTMLIRKQAILAVGGFDQSIDLAEDRDFCLKLARASEFDVVAEPLVDFRLHPTSTYSAAMARDPEPVLWQRLKIWNRWTEEIHDWPAVRSRFRAEAAAVSLSIAPPRLRLGLYGRLTRSELPLARKLFSNRGAYAVALLGEFLAVGEGRPSLLGRLKTAIAWHLILPHVRLVRWAQAMGWFKAVVPAERPRPGR